MTRKLIAIVTAILAVVGVIFYRNHQVALQELAAACPRAADLSDWKRLEQLSRSWLEKAPREPIAMFWLGEALQSQSRFEESLQVFENVRLSDPRGIDCATRRMNILYHAMHQPLLALEIATELLESDPTIHDAIRNRVHFFAMTFQRRNLIDEINTAIRSQADLPEHYVYLVTLEDLSFRDGTRIVSRWLQSSSDPSEELTIALLIHRTLAAREAALVRKTPESEEAYRIIQDEVTLALKKHPESLPLTELAIRMSSDSGDNQRIADLLAAAPDKAFDDPLIWSHRGKYSLDTGDTDDAETALQNALAIHPMLWKARNHLAAVLRVQQKTAESGQTQEIATNGAVLSGDCLRLNSVRDIKRPLLERIRGYAQECEAWTISDAIERRKI